MVLLHTKRAVDLSRVKTVGSVLFNHDPDAIVGSLDRVWVDEDDRKGRAVIRFDETEEGDLAFTRVKSGSLRGVSVSAKPTERQQLAEDDKWEDSDGRVFKGPLSIATRWQVVELSLTPVPADAATGCLARCCR